MSNLTAKWILRAGAALIVATGGASAFAAEPDVDQLARDLAAKPAPAPGCEKKLPDGSCPDQVDTRQLVLRGGATAAKPSSGSVARTAQIVTKAVRQNISMTFEKGSATLTASARATLDRMAKALVSVASYRPFMIEGHTDSSGPRETNMRLSQARADTVVNYLAAKGVDAKRMTAKGFGPDRPLPGAAASAPANRRVEASAS